MMGSSCFNRSASDPICSWRAVLRTTCVAWSNACADINQWRLSLLEACRSYLRFAAGVLGAGRPAGSVEACWAPLGTCWGLNAAAS